MSGHSIFFPQSNFVNFNYFVWKSGSSGSQFLRALLPYSVSWSWVSPEVCGYKIVKFRAQTIFRCVGLKSGYCTKSYELESSERGLVSSNASYDRASPSIISEGWMAYVTPSLYTLLVREGKTQDIIVYDALSLEKISGGKMRPKCPSRCTTIPITRRFDHCVRCKVYRLAAWWCFDVGRRRSIISNPNETLRR